MSKTVRFTKREIDALPSAAPGKRDYYEDARTPSLRLAVTDRGAKSWVIQRRIDGRVTRYTLGRFPDLTPENAKTRAEQIVGQIADGRNPQTEKRDARAKRLTLRDAFDEFIAVRKLKPSTVQTYRQIIEGALSDWQPRALTSITKDAVAERHAMLSRDSGGPYADSAMRTLRAIWNFVAASYEDASGESLLPPNPVDRLSKTKAWNRPTRRRTYIQAHELPAWFGAVQQLRGEPFGTVAQTVGDYLVLLILTGLRRTEGATLTWRQIDLAARTLTLTDTKNHESHVLPLPSYLHALLAVREKHRGGSPFVFPGEAGGTYLKEPRYQMARVIQQSGLRFMLHDLRRTFSTVAESLDLSHYSLKRLLNHRMSGDVTAGYIGANIDRLREPMQRIEDFLIHAGRVIPPAEIVDLPSVRGAARQVVPATSEIPR